MVNSMGIADNDQTLIYLSDDFRDIIYGDTGWLHGNEAKQKDHSQQSTHTRRFFMIWIQLRCVHADFVCSIHWQAGEVLARFHSTEDDFDHVLGTSKDSTRRGSGKTRFYSTDKHSPVGHGPGKAYHFFCSGLVQCHSSRRCTLFIPIQCECIRQKKSSRNQSVLIIGEVRFHTIKDLLS